MRTVSIVFATLLLSSALAPALATAPPTCWKVTGVDSSSYMADLVRTSCCATPSGTGWTYANFTPPDQYFLGERGDWYMNNGFLDYLGTDADGVPVLRWDAVICCPSSGFRDGPSPLAVGSCVDRLPLRNLIVHTAGGVFGTSRNTDNFVRKHWTSDWQTELIAHDSPDLVPGSLVEDLQLADWEVVYGVNFWGQIVILWNDGSAYRSAVLTATGGVDPFSLAPSDGHFLYGVTLSGELFHLDAAGRMVTVAYSGAPPVPESLIPSGGSTVYGVNTAGQIFGTWDFKGSIIYYLLPGTSDVHPESLVLNDNGLFYITNSGELHRTWWNGSATEVERIPHWGGPLMPSSLIAGEGIGIHANVYGINDIGRPFLTWNDNGTITFALYSLPIHANRNSLVLSAGNGVFGVTVDGDLFRTWWSGSAGTHLWEILPHWGGALVAESLIAGPGTGAHANIYGINEHGDVFTTWNDNGTIRFALVP